MYYVWKSILCIYICVWIYVYMRYTIWISYIKKVFYTYVYMCRYICMYTYEYICVWDMPYKYICHMNIYVYLYIWIFVCIRFAIYGKCEDIQLDISHMKEVSYTYMYIWIYICTYVYEICHIWKMYWTTSFITCLTWHQHRMIGM